MMLKELQAIANLAIKHNLVVITDEIYAELILKETCKYRQPSACRNEPYYCTVSPKSTQ